jgi:hypothetical protein
LSDRRFLHFYFSVGFFSELGGKIFLKSRMTSIIKKISQNPNGVSTAVLSGGNGSNGTTQIAIATIDPRYGNAFIIDTTGLTNTGADQYRIYIRVKSSKANVGASLPGKVIHLLFKLPPETAGSTKSVDCYFDTTLGNNIAPLATSGYWNGAMSISLIANGTEFQALTNSHDWGFGD